MYLVYFKFFFCVLYIKLFVCSPPLALEEGVLKRKYICTQRIPVDKRDMNRSTVQNYNITDIFVLPHSDQKLHIANFLRTVQQSYRLPKSYFKVLIVIAKLLSI